jgi:hypothetical protein
MMVGKQQSVIIMLVLVVLSNLYMIFVPDTSTSYSLIDTYEGYYPLNNWNMPHHTVGLFDDDNQDDVIDFTGCVFLTRTNNTIIDEENMCNIAGNPLAGRRLFREVQHSFLAKKPGENWMVHEQHFGIPRLYEIFARCNYRA